MVPVSLKSKRVPTSRRAWSRALVSSTASNSETTSKENSATGCVDDRVDAEVHRKGGQDDADQGADAQEKPDTHGSFVEGLSRRPVVRVFAVVEVIDLGLARPRHQLVQHCLATWREGFGAQRLDRRLEVVTSASKLGHDHVERLHGGRRRMLPAQVGDGAVQRHAPIHNRNGARTIDCSAGTWAMWGARGRLT